MTDGARSPRSTGLLALASVISVALASVLSATPVGAQADAATGWVRLGHFAAGGSEVDVVVDGEVRATGIGPGDVTPYVRVSPGTHRVEARPVGGDASIVDVQTGVDADASVTVGVVTTRDGVGAQVYDDAEAPPAPGRSLVRFIHTVPDVPAVDVAVVGGPVLASNVAYPAATPYLDVDPGTYDLELRRAGSTEVLLRVDDWRIAANAEATVVVSRATNGALSVVPLLDAGGTSTMPSGGAATGFGGTASHVVAGGTGGPIAMFSLAALALATLALAVRPRSRLALAVGASVGLTGCGSTRPAPVAEPRSTTTLAITTSVPAVPSSAPVASGANVNEPVAGEPLAVRVPSLGIDSTLVPLGRLADGTVEVPSTADQAGWYVEGPRPGEVGPAVILGHVDSTSGPGVFATLDRLRPGDEVVVDTTAGPTSFSVDRTEQVPKDRFPSEAVYGAVPGPELRLVTCGGAFDRSAGHYLDNVVVYLSAAGDPAP